MLNTRYQASASKQYEQGGQFLGKCHNYDYDIYWG